MLHQFGVSRWGHGRSIGSSNHNRSRRHRGSGCSSGGGKANSVFGFLAKDFGIVLLNDVRRMAHSVVTHAHTQDVYSCCIIVHCVVYSISTGVYSIYRSF